TAVCRARSFEQSVSQHFETSSAHLLEEKRSSSNILKTRSHFRASVADRLAIAPVPYRLSTREPGSTLTGTLRVPVQVRFRVRTQSLASRQTSLQELGLKT